MQYHKKLAPPSEMSANGSEEFDSTLYHTISIDSKIPPGTVSVPVLVDDNGIECKTQMVAGSIGLRISSSGQALDESRQHVYNGRRQRFMQDSDQDRPKTEGRTSPDSVQPVSGWWML